MQTKNMDLKNIMKRIEFAIASENEYKRASSGGKTLTSYNKRKGPTLTESGDYQPEASPCYILFEADRAKTSS